MDFEDIINVSYIENLPFEYANLENKQAGGGVYRMYDYHKNIVYVGKSQNLVRRLKQHKGKDTNTAYFIDEVVTVDWLKEANPILQNLLEAVFIAYHKPKYNDEVKDATEEGFL